MATNESFFDRASRIKKERGCSFGEAQDIASGPDEGPAEISPFEDCVRRIMSDHKVSRAEAMNLATDEGWGGRKTLATRESGDARLLRWSVGLDAVTMDLAPSDVHAPGTTERKSADADVGPMPPPPVWIQLAKPGKFLGHPAGPFEMNRETFDEVIANFKATTNRRIPIDYEHASEQDPTSGSIPIVGAPAQGWITDLKIESGCLYGLVEWGERACQQIRAGEYKFISPAIRFGSKDRVTGKPCGAKLTSAALTNMPFLDGMAPLTASDREPRSFSALTKHLMSAKGISHAAAQVEAAAIIGGRQ